MTTRAEREEETAENEYRWLGPAVKVAGVGGAWYYTNYVFNPALQK